MNIPVLFKIFLFFILKQGVSDKADLQDVSVSTIVQSFPTVSVLFLEGDASTLEQTISNCSMVFPIPTIVREPDSETGITIARLQYKDLPFSVKQKLEQQLLQFKGRINIQWNETSLQ